MLFACTIKTIKTQKRFKRTFTYANTKNAPFIICSFVLPIKISVVFNVLCVLISVRVMTVNLMLNKSPLTYRFLALGGGCDVERGIGQQDLTERQCQLAAGRVVCPADGVVAGEVGPSREVQGGLDVGRGAHSLGYCTA